MSLDLNLFLLKLPWLVWSLAKDLGQTFPLLNLVADKTWLRDMALYWISITFYWFKISKDQLLCLMEEHLHFLFHFAASLYMSRLTSQDRFFKIIGSEAYRVCCRGICTFTDQRASKSSHSLSPICRSFTAAIGVCALSDLSCYSWFLGVTVIQL